MSPIQTDQPVAPPRTAVCPRCGKTLELRAHPTKPGRLIGECGCNTSPEGLYLGPVIETNHGQPKAQWSTIKRVDTRNRGGDV